MSEAEQRETAELYREQAYRTAQIKILVGLAEEAGFPAGIASHLLSYYNDTFPTAAEVLKVMKGLEDTGEPRRVLYVDPRLSLVNLGVTGDSSGNLNLSKITDVYERSNSPYAIIVGIGNKRGSAATAREVAQLLIQFPKISGADSGLMARGSNWPDDEAKAPALKRNSRISVEIFPVAREMASPNNQYIPPRVYLNSSAIIRAPVA